MDDFVDNDNLDDKIRNRDNILKIYVTFISVTSIVIFIGIFSLKIVDGSIQLTFDFSDFLSLSLAIFSILLSALFYLKATETSNRFYDNTYNFTKDFSVVLGRIEAGFGEKLRHLDEDYKQIYGKIIPDRSQNETRENIREDEEKLNRKTEEKIKILEELADKAKLENEEKQEFLEKIKTKDLEIQKLTNELNSLRERSVAKRDFRLRRMKKYMRENVIPLLNLNYYIEDDEVTLLDEDKLTSEFNIIKGQISSMFIKDMIDYNMIDAEGNLTNQGKSFIIEALL